MNDVLAVPPLPSSAVTVIVDWPAAEPVRETLAPATTGVATLAVSDDAAVYVRTSSSGSWNAAPTCTTTLRPTCTVTSGRMPATGGLLAGAAVTVAMNDVLAVPPLPSSAVTVIVDWPAAEPVRETLAPATTGVATLAVSDDAAVYVRTSSSGSWNAAPTCTTTLRPTCTVRSGRMPATGGRFCGAAETVTLNV